MIAARTGRARSTIRRALRAHDRHGAEVIFGEHGPLTSRDARLCERAQGMGIPLSRCGDRFGKSVPAIHRAMLRDRVARLQALPLRWIDLPTFERADADEVLLGTTLVRENLPGPDRVIDLVEIAATQATPDRERLVAAGHCLLARAGHNLASLPGQPTARQVDAIECDLRWTGRIRGALVLEGLSAALQACEHWLGRPVKVLPREAALRFLTRCIHATWQVVEGLEPRLADRLESRCVAAIDRALATRTPPGRGRAAARHAPGDLRCPWPIRELVTWSWLEPGFSWVTRADGLDEDDRGLLSRRWGLGDTRPWRIAELAERRGSTATAVQRRLHAIEVRVRMDR